MNYDLLFSQNTLRIELMRLKENPNNKQIKIFIHRNHSFEMISSVLNKFFDFSQLKAEFKFSSYDDSLTFNNNLSGYDLHILWLDLSRYNKTNIKEFLNQKINELKSAQNAPILLGFINGDNFSIEISNVISLDIDKIVQNLGQNAYDYDNIQHSGTPLSQKACLYLARFLGLKIIPSMILPNLKAIIVDLDNTLYQGILGEDGINNLKPNLDLQKYLKYLCKQGFLLCICSKNEIEDVKNMLTSRKDFILKNNDFTIIKANWNTKSQNIKEIANELNIGLDVLLFIDDNIAEISEVKMNIPQIKTILAKDEQNTLNYLNLYPCLLKFNSNKEDKLRSKDIQANLQRHNLAKTMSKAEYFKELEIKLSFYLNNKAQIQRISELLNKTNQFILSYKRYTQTAVEKLLKDDCIITASMSDKLSDSGIIAIMICKKYEKTLILDELVVSCRALGRNIEDIMVLKMLNLAKDYLKTSNSTKIYYQQGPRNTPALLWLSKFANCDLKQNGILDLKIKNDFEIFGLKMEIL